MVVELSGDQKYLRYAHVTGEFINPAIELEKPVLLESLETSLLGTVISESESRLFDAHAIAEFAASSPLNGAERSALHWLGLPIRYADKLLGVLVCQRNEDRRFSKIDQQRLYYIASALSLAIWLYRSELSLQQRNQKMNKLRGQLEKSREETRSASKRLTDMLSKRKVEQEKLEYDAFHDKLTALPNRAFFNDRLQDQFDKLQAGESEDFAVFFLDLDGFKAINDTYGHQAGDELLKKISRQLLESVRPGDIVARLAGDEFCILLLKVINEKQAIRVASRIIRSFEREFWVGEEEVKSSCSIGITLNVKEYTNTSDVLRDADTAMYESKARGKNCYQIFDPSLNLQGDDRPDLESDVFLAMESGQIGINFQPVVDFATNDVVSLELWPVWQHEQAGLVTHDRFIECVQKGGLSVDLVRFVFDHGVEWITQWRESFRAARDLCLTVNLTTYALNEEEIGQVLAMMQEFDGSEGAELRLEMTEELLMEHFQIVADFFEQVKNTRMHLILDNFATGYSSLPLLYQLPLAMLKVDLSAMSAASYNDRNMAILKTLQALAENLGIALGALGVETEADVGVIEQINAAFVQGGMFHGRLDRQETEALLEFGSPMAVTKGN